MSVQATTRAWQSTASGHDLLVLLALADYAGGHDDPYDHAYPSVGRLQEMTKLSRRTVQRALRSLEDAGLIRATGRHCWGGSKTTIVYRIQGRPCDAPNPSGASTESVRGVSDDTLGASPVTPNPSLNPPIEPTPYKEDVAEVRSVALDLFVYWQQKCGHPNSKPTADRLIKIKARLGEGYSPDDIRRAIDGAARAAFVDDRGKRHDGLDLICRNGGKLEDFMARATAQPRQNGRRQMGPSAEDFMAVARGEA